MIVNIFENYKTALETYRKNERKIKAIIMLCSFFDALTSKTIA